ncbi:MAG TPA: phage holin family protein [Myxococcota bacterium]|nr:phage holin family protein [Myxococcota bacterium]
MSGFLIRLVISAFALWVADYLVDGITIDSTTTLFLAALVLGIVNAVVRPIFVVLTFPLTLLTLGLFLLVVNALMLGLVASVLPGFHIVSFGAAFLGSVIVSLVSWAASAWIGPSGRFEVLVVERRPRP